MTFPTRPGSRRRAGPRSTKALLATAAVALSSVLMTAGAQAAPPPPGEDETISVHGGYAEFHHYGEILVVNDGVLDGRGVRVEFGGLGSSGIGDYQLSDYEADGEEVSRDLPFIPEHQKVAMRVCYTVDHLSTECSEWQRAIT